MKINNNLFQLIHDFEKYIIFLETSEHNIFSKFKEGFTKTKILLLTIICGIISQVALQCINMFSQPTFLLLFPFYSKHFFLFNDHYLETDVINQ